MAKPVGPYTPIVRAGEWLVVSGQVGIADGKLVAGGLEAELRQAVANLEGLLASEGRPLQDVTKTTVFLKHLATDYARMNEVYIELFGDHRPARSAIGVAELPIGAGRASVGPPAAFRLVELEALGPRGGRMTPCSG